MTIRANDNNDRENAGKAIMKGLFSNLGCISIDRQT
jgi:hypothetical protein